MNCRAGESDCAREHSESDDMKWRRRLGNERTFVTITPYLREFQKWPDLSVFCSLLVLHHSSNQENKNDLYRYITSRLNTPCLWLLELRRGSACPVSTGHILVQGAGRARTASILPVVLKLPYPVLVPWKTGLPFQSSCHVLNCRAILLLLLQPRYSTQ